MSEATIVERVLVYHQHYRLWRLRVRMPDRVEVERHLEDHGPAAVVLPYDPDRRVATLVSMPRAPLIDTGEAALLEAVAGYVEPAGAEQTARDEAEEEAGLRLGVLEPVAVAWTMPSFSTERLHLFLARYTQADRIGAGGGSATEHENIAVHELPLAQLRQWRQAGLLTDAKTLILVQALELSYPALFAAPGR